MLIIEPKTILAQKVANNLSNFSFQKIPIRTHNKPIIYKKYIFVCVDLNSLNMNRTKNEPGDLIKKLCFITENEGDIFFPTNPH